MVAGDVKRGAVGEHLQRELGGLVALRGLVADVAAVARTRQREKTRLLVEKRVHLGGREFLRLHDREDGRRVDVAAARPHDETGERRQAHRRVNDLAVADRRERRAVAKVARDEVHLRERLFEELRRRVRDELVRRPVEAILADAERLVILRRDRIHRRAVGHRRDVERRVEDADVRNALEKLLARLDAAQVRGHVKGPELDELLDLRHVRLRHRDGVLEDFRPVEDAVANRVNALRVLAQLGDDLAERVRVGLRSAAADALDDALLEPRLRGHVEELVFEGARPRVDDENFPDCLFHCRYCTTSIL